MGWEYIYIFDRVRNAACVDVIHMRTSYIAIYVNDIVYEYVCYIDRSVQGVMTVGFEKCISILRNA